VIAERRFRDVEIVVRDNGAGISADALPVIFNRLDQGGRAAARRHGGLGLGLAIVRQVVELHHGLVRAESAGLGHGATFTIVLPATKPGTTEAHPPPVRHVRGAHAASVSMRGLRILVVEDADDARQLLEQFLTSQGAAVTAVGSAETALEWFSGHQADVIISDIEMPVQDGLQLLRSIRSRQPHGASTPAIALTAYGTVDDRERSRASGFQVHLTKPVDLTELVETVAALCNTETTLVEHSGSA
jgi:CheY-like chemotaxis protein